MREYKSFLKTVGGNEGNKCHYPTRPDTYGCGCAHDCSYCYAKSLLDFRGLWNSQNPAVADIEKIKKALDKIPSGKVLRLGGMTDCFQYCELEHGVTLQTIKEMNKRGIGYLIVTKSDLVARDEYIEAMDKRLAHIQVTVTCVDDDFYRKKAYEKAPVPSRRIAAILKLQDAGFDTAIRLSPLMEEYMNFDKLNSLGIKKGIVEFLRVNHWIQKWFDVDVSKYTVKESGYWHLPLSEKIRILNRIGPEMEISVCEDETEAYKFWKEKFNPNPADCCNLNYEENLGKD